MYALCLTCPDQPGLVAVVATALANHSCNIEDSAQFHDPGTERLFMRIAINPPEEGAEQRFAAAFPEIADRFSMDWSLTDLTAPLKTVLMVSKASHCLNDLLYRWRTKALNIDITAVISNHEVNRELVESRGIPYHRIDSSDKQAAEAEIRRISEDTGADLLVLARYMQVLTPEMCADYAGRVINIHHSFLPGFKGARPYDQAYQRGVKLIGATAHFATPDLDEGPIIEQSVIRVDHSHDPKQLQMDGRDTEAKVLAKAIQLYAQRRIFLNGVRTVIL